MPDQSPFKSDYDKGEGTTSRTDEVPPEKPITATSQAFSTGPGSLSTDVANVQLFGTDYDKGEGTTSRTDEVPPEKPTTATSQTPSTGPGSLSTDVANVKLFGAEKPRRVVIRGRISRES